jgi:polar amino acid transport system substrate-binding protein
MYKKSLLITVGLLITLLNTSAFACDKKTYTIGVQAIDYSPHYNFVTNNSVNFFEEFIVWLKHKTGCNFEVVSLPIKRLNLAFEQQKNIDFIYPDNPNWHDTTQVKKEDIQRTYSPEITSALGGTMVKAINKNISLTDFNILAIPRGFTPVAWLPLQNKYKVKFREVTDGKAALLMVQTGRVDGADIEYNVAQYLINKYKLTPLVLAKNLPFTPTGFHLSTFSQLKMMSTINELVINNQADINEIKQKVKLLEKTPKT